MVVESYTTQESTDDADQERYEASLKRANKYFCWVMAVLAVVASGLMKYMSTLPAGY
jgi:hypothetical protein